MRSRRLRFIQSGCDEDLVAFESHISHESYISVPALRSVSQLTINSKYSECRNKSCSLVRVFFCCSSVWGKLHSFVSFPREVLKQQLRRKLSWIPPGCRNIFFSTALLLPFRLALRFLLLWHHPNWLLKWAQSRWRRVSIQLRLLWTPSHAGTSPSWTI